MLASAIIRLAYLGLMFLAGLVLSNIAQPEKFGTISLLVLNASLLSVVTSLGADTLVLYKVSNGVWGNAKAAKFTWMAIAIQLLIFLVLESGSLMIWNTTLLSNEGLAFLPWDIAFFVGLLLTEKYLALLYAFHHARMANILLAGSAFFYLLLLLFVYYVETVSIQTVIALFAGQSFVQGLLLLCFFYWKQRPVRNEQLHLHEFFSLVKFSSLVMITNTVQLLAYRVDFWLIQYFWGKYDVGIYAQANKFANLCWLLPNIMAQLLLPKFPGFEQKQIQEIFSAAFYVNMVLILLTLFCTHLFYAYYLSPAYSKGLPAFHLMLPGYFFWACVIYIGAFVSASGKFSYNLACSSACFVLVLMADIIFIPLFGIKGAGLANTISYTAVFFIYLYILVNKFSFRLNDLLWPRRQMLKSLTKILFK
ncbi:polysaccharide biosynthesis C-terminal domain-containing protein [Flavisolibacter sp. BT320]|nr:polysaccharide biosynthesis C-terminal domain-containing protein [Flavisolibacter longurius]